MSYDADMLRALTIDAARAGASVLRERLGRALTSIGSKTSSTDMVTDADHASEAAVIEVIARARPDDALLGEESGARTGTSGLRWVIDPLDGTTNFLYGLPQFCVSVAVEDADGAIAGCILDPNRGEEFVAARGAGATCNDIAIRVSGATDLATSLIGTGFSYLAEEREAAARLLPYVLPRVRDIRRPGSAALDLAWVACGRFDGFYEAPVFPWDGAAGILLVREAGGIVTEMAPTGPRGPGLIAAGPGIHADLVALIAAARDAAGLRS
jgi:myo-inositol-1(or 4)-monophosphatase